MDIEIVKEIFDHCCKAVEPTKAKNFEEFKIEYESCQRNLPEFKRCAKMFNDSIHGPIEVNSLELEIIVTPEFFRLKEIKQLGGKFHVYPGATHTRFEHSIGVCHLAGELVDHLRKQLDDINKGKKETSSPRESGNKGKEEGESLKIEDQEEKCVRLAGLCHDLGHGPFSHLFESVARHILERDDIHHEDLSVLVFKKILLDNPVVLARFVTQCDMKLEHVIAIEQMIVPKLDKIKTPKKFLYEIVANKQSGMDVDKWDYFARDFLHLGVTNEFDWRRTMKLSAIVKCKDEYHLGFRDKEIENIYGMFRTRSILYQKALRHKTVQAIEMMIEDILYEARDEKMLDISGIDDSSPLRSIKEVLQQAYKEKKPNNVKGYLALTDSIMSQILFSKPAEEKNLKKARKLIMRLQTRDLYKRKGEEPIGDPIALYKRSKGKESIQRFLEIFYRNDEREVKLVCFKFASEKTLNPIEEIYFFEKQTKICVQSIPPRDKNEKLIKDVSLLCKPKEYIEFRVRTYLKSTQSEDTKERVKEKLNEELKECVMELTDNNKSVLDLTIPDAVEAKWHDIGNYIKVPEATLKSIEESHDLSSAQRFQGLMKYWTNPEKDVKLKYSADRIGLICALHDLKLTDLAEQMRK